MWRNVRVTNCPVTKCPCDELSVTKCPVTKCPVTICPPPQFSAYGLGTCIYLTYFLRFQAMILFCSSQNDTILLIFWPWMIYAPFLVSLIFVETVKADMKILVMAPTNVTSLKVKVIHFLPASIVLSMSKCLFFGNLTYTPFLAFSKKLLKFEKCSKNPIFYLTNGLSLLNKRATLNSAYIKILRDTEMIHWCFQCYVLN